MKMLSHFTYLKDTGFNFPAPVQTMIILCKLPPTMEVVAQILSQMSLDEIKNLKLEGIVKAAMLSFEQKGTTHGGSKGPQANKLSTVKCKPADTKFAQQQQQGGSNGGASRNAMLLPKDREAALAVVARKCLSQKCSTSRLHYLHPLWWTWAHHQPSHPGSHPWCYQLQPPHIWKYHQGLQFGTPLGGRALLPDHPHPWPSCVNG